jgi:hypothetical protein
MRAGFTPELEQRLRRADVAARPMVEAEVVTAGDIKQRKDQWNAAGNPKDVAQFVCQVNAMTRHTHAGGGIYAYDLTPLHPPVGATVGAEEVATEYTFTLPWSVQIAKILPTYFHTPGYAEADPFYHWPVAFIFIWAITSTGAPASNVGWAFDSATPYVTAALPVGASGSYLLGGKFPAEQPPGNPLVGLYVDSVAAALPVASISEGTPRITLDYGTYAGPTTIAFTGAANKLDLGSVPGAAADVRFMVGTELPSDTAILAEAQEDGGSSWKTINDGDTAADVGLPAAQKYDIRAQLTKNTNGDVSPVLRRLGAEVVSVTDLADSIPSRSRGL